MPAEGTDARRELRDFGKADRHAALVVGVEPHAARAGGVERGELLSLMFMSSATTQRARFGVSALSAAMPSRMAELSVP